MYTVHIFVFAAIVLGSSRGHERAQNLPIVVEITFLSKRKNIATLAPALQTGMGTLHCRVCQNFAGCVFTCGR